MYCRKRKLCKQKMEFTVGDAVTPKPDPQLAPVVIPNACDTPKAVAAITVGNAEKGGIPVFQSTCVGDSGRMLYRISWSTINSGHK